MGVEVDHCVSLVRKTTLIKYGGSPSPVFSLKFATWSSRSVLSHRTICSTSVSHELMIMTIY